MRLGNLRPRPVPHVREIDGFGGPTPDAGEFASGLCSANTSVDLENTVADFGDGYTPLARASPTGSAGLTIMAWESCSLAASSSC